MTEAITSPALRYHGAKFRLAPWILQFFPGHQCYVESFGGAAGVLLQKPRSYAEVYNDLDGDIVNFFRVLQNDEQREKLQLLLTVTPYARDEFNLAWEPAADPIERARRVIIRAQMGFGSASATKGKTGFRIDTKREHSTTMQLWARYPESIATIGKRFQRVLIENRPAVEIMMQHDGEQTLHYVDPPYVHETRKMRGSSHQGYYRHEMTDDQHVTLLSELKRLKGMVILSGYETDLYHETLVGWKRYSTESRISAGRGTGIRIENIWINPACYESLQMCDTRLFKNA